jgi:hypothetical protein
VVSIRRVFTVFATALISNRRRATEGLGAILPTKIDLYRGRHLVVHRIVVVEWPRHGEVFPLPFSFTKIVDFIHGSITMVAVASTIIGGKTNAIPKWLPWGFSFFFKFLVWVERHGTSYFNRVMVTFFFPFSEFKKSFGSITIVGRPDSTSLP